MPSSSKSWFAPKRYGYGSSWPVVWQGWAALVVFLLLVGVVIRALSGVERFAAIVFLVAGFMIVCALKTEGGWQWRWDKADP